MVAAITVRRKTISTTAFITPSRAALPRTGARSFVPPCTKGIPSRTNREAVPSWANAIGPTRASVPMRDVLICPTCVMAEAPNTRSSRSG